MALRSGGGGSRGGGMGPGVRDSDHRRRIEREERSRRENERRRQRAERERLARERAERERIAREKRQRAYINSLINAKSQLQKDIARIKSARFFNEQAKQDMEKLRHYLKSQTWWETSEAGELTSLLAAFIKVHCDLIFDLLGVIPAPQSKIPGITISVAKDLITSLMKEDFEYGKLIGYLTDADALQKYSSATILIKLNLAFLDYGIGIGELTEIPKNVESLRQEVVKQIDRIEMEIFNYEIRIKNSEGLEELKQHSIRAMDMYIKKIN